MDEGIEAINTDLQMNIAQVEDLSQQLEVRTATLPAVLSTNVRSPYHLLDWTDVTHAELCRVARAKKEAKWS